VKFLIPVFLLLFTHTVFAGGFEKVVQWSARYSGIAGAASSIVDGADSVFFNPAGMSWRKKGDHDIAINIAPTFSQTKGPIYNTQQDLSERLLSPTGGAFASHNLFKNFDFGYGVYVAGGTLTKYREVNFQGIHDDFIGYYPDIISNLAVFEGALAASYKFTKNFSFGAAWRISHVKAEFSSAKVTYTTGGTPLALSSLAVDDIEAKKYTGFKFGFQYRSDDGSWGTGLAYRSEVQFDASGDVTGKVVYSATGAGALALQGINVRAGEAKDLTAGKRTIRNTFPRAVSWGGFWKPNDTWTLLAEYTWTDYSANEWLMITGKYRNTVTNGLSDIPDVRQKWRDQHQLKLAAEYMYDPKVTFRGGYAITSEVTPDNAARATFTPPGIGHTFTLGGGYAFNKMKSIADCTLEYSRVWATGYTPDEHTSATQRTPDIRGKFMANALGIYFSYRQYF